MWQYEPPDIAALAEARDDDAVRVAGCGCVIERPPVHSGQPPGGAGWPGSAPAPTSPRPATDAEPEDSP